METLVFVKESLCCFVDIMQQVMEYEDEMPGKVTFGLHMLHLFMKECSKLSHAALITLRLSNDAC